MTTRGLTVEIVHGGRPDAATSAAIDRAVATVLARRRPSAPSAPPATPAWRRAALREGVGGARAVQPDRRA